MPSVDFNMQNLSFGLDLSTAAKSEHKLKIYLHIFVHFTLSAHINVPLMSFFAIKYETWEDSHNQK